MIQSTRHGQELWKIHRTHNLKSRCCVIEATPLTAAPEINSHSNTTSTRAPRKHIGSAPMLGTEEAAKC